MPEDHVTTVKDAVHKVQLALLEGIEGQNQLFAAGSLMSRSDYEDVVTERSIAGVCGYPLCGIPLPSERPRKGHYRISLREHKVYDLQDTYMYCSSNCVINSHTFAATLLAERCSVFNSTRVNEILSLFKNQSFEMVEVQALGKNGHLGFSELNIQEKTETKDVEVSLEDWIGVSSAVEGYVPRRDRSVKCLPSKSYRKGACETNAVEVEQTPLKWPKKSGISSADVFDSPGSWFDLPPEGFSPTLSPFATMWNALSSWMTCSSLAYIYGKGDSLHKEFLQTSGREYPRKVVLSGGRSSEIKGAMASCLARAMPSVVEDLKLQTPLSTLEKELAHLVETMSFTEALPAFRVKQWQVVILLFLEALSISRITGLAANLSSRRTLIPKVLDCAQMKMDDYQFLKDIIIPLGPQP